jgi:hypothetical protein
LKDAGDDLPDDLPLLWTYDGTTQLGRVYAAGRRFVAVTGNGRELGTYGTIPQARAAIIDAAARDRVRQGHRYVPSEDELLEARAWRRAAR